MLKVLLKKQFMSMFTQIGNKQGKGKRGIIGYIAIVVLLMAFCAIQFYAYANMVAAPLANAGMGWLYFVFAGMMSLLMSVVMGVFMTQSGLYEAKDNELLLSLPIPSKYILFVRMVPLYAQDFLFNAAVLIPAYICWGMLVPVTAVQVVIWLLMLIILPLLSLFIACLVGLIVSAITSRMRDKTLFTMIFSLAFMVIYFVLYSLFITNMDVILGAYVEIGNGIKTLFYPLYALGEACMGDFAGFAVSGGIIVALFAALYIILSKTYIGLVTRRVGGHTAKYNGKVNKPSSPFFALLKKEARRFFGSGIYMLNAGLGAIMLVVATMFFVIKSNSLADILGNIEGISANLPIFSVLIISLISAMDLVSAPSVSLEGKTLWILQSTPAGMWNVLKAKLLMHYLVTGPIATVCAAIFAIVLRPGWAMIILMLIVPSLIVALSGVVGLVMNLLKPNLNWENETIVIKQSKSVLFSMLIVWGACALFTVLFLAIDSAIPTELFLLICALIVAAGTAGLMIWLKKRGAVILGEL